MECPTCGKEFSDLISLSRHVGHSSNHISTKDFYDQYIKVDGEGICLTCGAPTKLECVSRGYFKYCCRHCSRVSPIKNQAASKCAKSSIVRQKYKETCLLRFGVDNVMKNTLIQNKLKETLHNKPKSYWVDRNTKSVITYNLRYGVDNPFQDDDVKEKIKKSNIKKYGVPYASQSKANREKVRMTSLERYGVDNYSKTPEARRFFRERFIRDIENQKLNGETLKGRIGYKERICLNKLQCLISYPIIRNHQLVGYLPDGYIEKLNIVIEFDEHWHQYSWARRHDAKKNLDYSYYGFDCFRIKEFDWLNNENGVCDHFLLFISDCEKKRIACLNERTD